MTITATALSTPGDATSIQSIGNMWSVFATLTFSGSYATGGDALDPIALGLFPEGASQVMLVDVSGSAGYGFEYDKTNKKIKLFSAANTELAAGAYNAALTGDVNIVAQIFAK